METVRTEDLEDQAVKEVAAATAMVVEAAMVAVAVRQALEVPRATSAFRTG